MCKVSVIFDVPVSPNLARKDSKEACAFVQSTRLPDGAVFCAYRRGSGKHGPDGVLVAQRSCDGGRSWESPVTIFDESRLNPPRTVISGGIAALGDVLVAAWGRVEMRNPQAYVFSAEARGFLWEVCLSRSADQGATWSPAVKLATASCRVAGIATKPYILPGSGLCVPIEYTIESGPQATAGLISRDGGRSFAAPRVFAADPAGELSLCDARFGRLSSGEYLMHLWTFRHKTEETINVHQSRSADGENWSRPVPLNIVGQICTPLEIEPGFIVAACNHRQAPQGIQLWSSSDSGRTWCDQPLQMWDASAARVLAQKAAARVAAGRENVWDELRRFSFGTPDLLLLEDRTVLMTYYATVEKVFHVRACRFRVG